MDTTLTLLAAFSLSVAATDPSIDAAELTKNMNDDNKAIQRSAPVRKDRRPTSEVMAESKVPKKTTL